MSRIASPFKIGKDFCEALGLPTDRVRSFTLHLGVDQVTTVTAELYVTPEQQEAAVAELKRYYLMEVEGDEVSPDLG